MNQTSSSHVRRNSFPHLFSVGEIPFIFICALFFASLENVAFWRRTFQVLPLNGPSEVLLYASFFIFLTCFIYLLFLFIVWKPIAKPVIIVLLLLSAAVNYFCITYGVYIDREMMLNATRTNMHETLSLMTPQFFMWFFLLGILPAVTVCFTRVNLSKPFFKQILLRVLSMVICIGIIAIAVLPLYKEYASFFRNNKEIVKLVTPSNYIHGAYSVVKQFWHSNQPLEQIGLDARQIQPDGPHKPTLFILVVGETGRAQNFSLFGYERNTNPKLSQQPGVIAFQNTSSCGTATATSVPCMFSDMTRANYSASLAERQENLLDVLNHAGVRVFWNENNTGCQGVCLRIASGYIPGVLPYKDCQTDFCHDLRLLEGIDSYITEQPNGDQFIVLHTIGSHGPSYYLRYPEDMPGKFEHSCDTNQIQNCNTEELVNVYDNTVLYTDEVLNQIINLLKRYEPQYETGMLYVSDHGESLGENGMYLHSAPYVIAPKEQTHIPMIFWSSTDFLTSRNIDFACLQQRARNETYSHDNLFHSMLGVMRVATQEYRSELDLFSPCRRR